MAIKQSSHLSDLHLGPEYLAYFWRGHCLNHFSRGEVAISDCIEALREFGEALDANSRHPGAAARSRALRLALQSRPYGGHTKVALQRLVEWDDLSLERAGLAHGLFKCTPRGVTITLTEYLSGERRDHPPKFHSLDDMRSYLSRLEACVQKLDVQLGQIEAYCRRHTA